MVLLVVEFFLHLRQGLLLGLLSYLPLELLAVDLIFEHLYLVLVVVFDSFHHLLLLVDLLYLVLFELPLLIQELALFQVTSQFVHFLAQTHLLRIAFEHLAALLVHHLLLELALPDGFDPDVTSHASLLDLGVFNSFALLELPVQLVFLHQSSKLPFLLGDAFVCFERTLLSLREGCSCPLSASWRSTSRLLT